MNIPNPSFRRCVQPESRSFSMLWMPDQIRHGSEAQGYSMIWCNTMRCKIRFSILFILIPFIASPLYGAEIAKATPPSAVPSKTLTALEKQLLKIGFVDVQDLDPTIKVELKYASDNNFMKTNVYGDFKRAYLRREAAEKLAKANSILKALHPNLTLLVGDALRPRHVQRKMRALLEGTPMENYVANPRGGSMHNYGCAVDVTIMDEQNNRLDMGTPMDHFGILSQIRHEDTFLKEGKLTEQQVANRRLLRKVMVEAGFRPLAIEWWHFDAFDKHDIRKMYTIVE